MEERTQQLATHSPALCVPLFTLTLVTDFRYSWLTYRFQRTHWHHELVSRRSPNLTEKGYTLSGRKRYVRMDGLDPPRIASQVEQYARMLPELLEFIDESVLQVVERRENGIGEGLAQMAENLLSWVQFWTVGREIERMHIV